MSGGQGERNQSAEYLLHLLYTSYGDTFNQSLQKSDADSSEVH